MKEVNLELLSCAAYCVAMQHGPWSGATRPPPPPQTPTTFVVVFQRGGVRATKLEGFCRIRNGRLELFDGPDVHANILGGRSFTEVGERFLARDPVVLENGYRVQWAGDTLASLQAHASSLEPMQAPATKKRRVNLAPSSGLQYSFQNCV